MLPPPVPSDRPADRGPSKPLKIFLVLLGVGVLGIVGMTLWTVVSLGTTMMDATREVANLSGDTEPPPDPTRQTVSISAAELSRAYLANEIAADRRFKDKALKIVGTVASIAREDGGAPFVTLVGAEPSRMAVRAFFPEEATPRLAKLKKGEKLTVGGVCEGESSGGVRITGAWIAKRAD